MNADLEEQEDELLALQSIFGSEEFIRNESKAAGEIRVSVELPADFTVVLKEGETLRQYDISFLPPLLLTFELPHHYPSSSPPSFSLACCWLTHTQLSALTARLIELYQATGGAVVLFSWAQFLKEETLSFLGLHNVLELPSDEDVQRDPESNTGREKPLPSENSLKNISDDSVPVGEKKAERASQPSEFKADFKNEGAASLSDSTSELQKAQTLSGLSLSQMLLSRILIHQAEQKQKAFASTLFECGVCFITAPGSECVQLSECHHIFCQACLAEFCRVRITEGTVRGLTCPQADCTATPTPAQVRSLVGDELFSRYDRLLLQSTLDLMSDVVYCPRRSCGSAVILEKSSTAAMCSVCNFAFCVTCRKTYHGAEDCYAPKQQKEDELEEILDLPETNEGIKALMDDYTSGSAERKRLLEKRYGRSVMLFTIEEMLSNEWMKGNSKNCPHCFSKIEKNGGCDMMVCRCCTQRFCWACLSRLSSRRERVGDCSSCAFW
ncbi:E3 ubiquitin-protein ligase RNF14-like isoform X2 [Betta splendens]|uniref:RBR-type E3 ubiquitin transferase n=1 Tax=Betta splendens TaxID=158456 RepID=A0A6P7M957_BETSP|nr:E3 ubiquitin-protein ligase RNF14-like isoform X2 [Betta splendens]